MSADSLLRLVSPDISTTHRLAAALAERCTMGDCILLRGDLGTGKTTFSRGFIEARAGEKEVVSPTFNLVQTYPIPGGMIWHFDLYRLRSPGEIAELGLEDALLSGITLIEWPDMVQTHLPAAALTVSLAYGKSDGERIIELTGAPAWKERLKGITP